MIPCCRGDSPLAGTVGVTKVHNPALGPRERLPVGYQDRFRAAEELGHTDDLGNLVDEYGAEYLDANF